MILQPLGSMGARRNPGNTLNLSSAIICTRASEASYQTGAETDGDTVDFIEWAPADVLRIQNRGTRNAVFIEGSRTNRLLYSRVLTNIGGWTAAPAPNRSVQTAAAHAGPDGDGFSTRVESGGLQFSSSQNTNPGFPCIASQWARAVAGTSPVYMNFYHTRNGSPLAATTLTTTYQRLRSRVPTATDVGSYYPADGTLTGGSPSDVYIGLMQVESGHFTTSVIRTTASSATRAADACVIPDASVPAWLRSGKWQFTFSLECTSAEFVATAADMTLFAFGEGTNDRVFLRMTSSSMRVRIMQGGAVLLTTAAITATSRYLDITVTVDSVAGEVTIAGATTGNGTTTGTPWVMQTGDVHVGAESTGAAPYFGEILPLVSQVP